MKVAFADTSAIVAVLLGEPGGEAVRTVLGSLDGLLAANLLEAEVLAVANREGVDPDAVAASLSHVTWVFPDRVLTREIRSVLGAGGLRGADCWHLACALYVAEEPKRLPFLTLDRAQAKVARTLGFPNAGLRAPAARQ